MSGGLPSLAYNIETLIDTIVLDAAAVSSLFPMPAPVYGIFDGTQGTEVLTGYDQVCGFSFQADEKVSAYPIEQGGFANYNKVALPFSGRIEYRVSGMAKRNFLTQCEALRSNTKTYTLVSPDYSWDSVNVTHHDHRRDPQHGFDMVTFTVWLEEIRQANGAQFSNTGTQTGTTASPTATQSPDAQAQQADGNVQPLTSNSGALAGANATTYAQIAGENVTPPPLPGS